MNKKFFILIRVVITVAILVALFKFVPYARIIEVYKNSQKNYLFLSIAIFLSNYIVGTFRWRFLLSSLQVKVSFKESFYALFSGLFFNLFFFSFVAGDIFRAAAIAKRHDEKEKIVSSVLMDRFSGASALVALAVFASFVGFDLTRGEPAIASALFLLSAVMICSGLLIFTKFFFNLSIAVFKRTPSLHKRIISFHDQLYFFKKNPGSFFKSMLFSLTIQTFTAVGFFVAAKAFYVDISIIYFLILVPIIMAIALIPITVAGAGTRDAAAIYFLSLIGIEKSIGLSISFLNLLSMIIAGIAGGILYVAVCQRYFRSRS
jgi:glycosyltransferase 2 family protein